MRWANPWWMPRIGLSGNKSRHLHFEMYTRYGIDCSRHLKPREHASVISTVTYITHLNVIPIMQIPHGHFLRVVNVNQILEGLPAIM